MNWTKEELNNENLKLINQLSQAHKLIDQLKNNYDKLYEEYLKARDVREQVNIQTELMKEQANHMKKEEQLHEKNLKLLEEQNDHIREIGHQLFHFVQEYLSR